MNGRVRLEASAALPWDVMVPPSMAGWHWSDVDRCVVCPTCRYWITVEFIRYVEPATLTMFALAHTQRCKP